VPPGALCCSAGHAPLKRDPPPPTRTPAVAADKASEGDASSHQSGASEQGLVSDYSRGKRLKKLLRLLNSRVALETILTFKSHM